MCWTFSKFSLRLQPLEIPTKPEIETKTKNKKWKRLVLMETKVRPGLGSLYRFSTAILISNDLLWHFVSETNLCMKAPWESFRNSINDLHIGPQNKQGFLEEESTSAGNDIIWFCLPYYIPSYIILQSVFIQLSHKICQACWMSLIDFLETGNMVAIMIQGGISHCPNISK